MLASITFAVLAADILLAKAQVVMGESAPVHLGDLAQFILLLIAVIFFVIGTLEQEKLVEGESEKMNRKFSGKPGPEDEKRK